VSILVRRSLPVLLVPLLLAGCGDLFATAAATVDGRKIDEDRFATELEFLLADPRLTQGIPEDQTGDQRRRELGRQYLTFLIHQQIVESYAEAEGIEAPPAEVDSVLDQQVAELGGQEQFDLVLARAGASQEDARLLFEQQVLRQHVAEAVVSQEVTDEQLRQVYDQRLLEFSQVHVAHILVRTEAEAERLAKQATPQNFGDLARQHSLDTQSAPNGGDLGPQRAVDLVEPFARATLRIPVGEVGGPVETEFGFHLIHVIARQALSFEEARPQLVGELRGQVFTDWLLERVARAEIRVNPRYGYFDEATGAVQERTSSTPLPGPSIQIAP
jgi:parvulin-like peptidyl-prolyl isomerase